MHLQRYLSLLNQSHEILDLAQTIRLEKRDENLLDSTFQFLKFQFADVLGRG